MKRGSYVKEVGNPIQLQQQKQTASYTIPKLQASKKTECHYLKWIHAGLATKPNQCTFSSMSANYIQQAYHHYLRIRAKSTGGTICNQSNCTISHFWEQMDYNLQLFSLGCWTVVTYFGTNLLSESAVNKYYSLEENQKQYIYQEGGSSSILVTSCNHHAIHLSSLLLANLAGYNSCHCQVACYI